MADWDKLFLDEKFIAVIPQPEVYKFIRILEDEFPARPLSIWDFCCGAGRHTVLIAQMGHNAFGSDISENGINHTRKLLDRQGLTATLKVADMTENIYPGGHFHGAISWDALHHNTIENIRKAVSNIYGSLCHGGMFMASLLSAKSGGAALRGREIEDGTYIADKGDEAGVLHHYFDEQGIRNLFESWRIVSLADIVVDYIQSDIDFSVNPFPYTKWNIIAQKP